MTLTYMDYGVDIQPLDKLHADINACRLCHNHVPAILKPESMKRGNSGNIAIIGQGPGKHELKKREAFSGPSGKKLNQWLVRSGAQANNPRAAIYFTSVVKCVAPSDNYLPQMIRNCRLFLNRQLVLIRPSLIITLGKIAYEELSIVPIQYDQALCKAFRTDNYALLTSLGFHYTLLAWPHPSGLNRWHNDANNQSLLDASFDIVRQHLL